MHCGAILHAARAQLLYLTRRQPRRHTAVMEMASVRPACRCGRGLAALVEHCMEHASADDDCRLAGEF